MIRTMLKLMGVFALLLGGSVALARIGYAQEPAGQDIQAQAVLGPSFTYQGVLKNNGNPANGSYQFRFKLYNALNGGSQIGNTQTKTALVQAGQFTVSLNFGATAFKGERRYLEIAVRPAGSTAAFTLLSPRQELTATPYALHARSVFALDAPDETPKKALFVDNDGDVGINLTTTNAGQKLHLGDGNLLIEGSGETAIKIKRIITYTTGPSGISKNPIFEFGRVISAGDGDPEIRLLYSDDITSERAVFEVDRKGIVASVKQDVGSHFEGFISGTDPEPIFRLNSYPKMRLEMGKGGTTPVDVAVQREATATLSFITGISERVRINAVGNVGIGTTNPLDRLHVKDGNIRVENGSFIDDGITLNVPDYVFEEDYHLMSLDELQAYLDQKKHLPGVPSAAEIKAEGLNLSEFQMALLEKIEELTLYTLAQQERLEALEQQVTALQQEKVTLKEELSDLK